MARFLEEIPIQVFSIISEAEGESQETNSSQESSTAGLVTSAPKLLKQHLKDACREDTLPSPKESQQRNKVNETPPTEEEETLDTESEHEDCNEMGIMEDLEQLNGKGKQRRSYRRETKLAIIQYCHSTQNNKYKTAKEFGITCSTLRGWLKNEARIASSCSGARKIGCGRHSFWPDMERELHRQYQEAKEKGVNVKPHWFKAKSKELMMEMHPEVDFKSTSSWLQGFKQRNLTINATQCNHQSKDVTSTQDSPQVAEEGDSQNEQHLERSGSQNNSLSQREMEESETPGQEVSPSTSDGKKAC